MNMHYDKLLKKILKIYGYQYEIRKIERILCRPEYELYIFDDRCPEWGDPETDRTEVAPGERNKESGWAAPKTTWLYGHHGFQIDQFDGTACEVHMNYSEYAVCKAYLKELFAGHNYCLDRIPASTSIEELKFKIAVFNL